jgi:hypothetical protein
MIEKIEIGDYLYYNGQFGSDICQLESFVENFGKRLSICLLASKKNIVCDYEDVRLLRTREDHILSLGFSKPQQDKERYIHPQLVICSAGLIHNQTLINIPISAVDFHTVNVDLLSYYNGKTFDYKRLDQDYPSVYFLKDFFKVLDQHNISHDKLKLAQLKHKSQFTGI